MSPVEDFVKWMAKNYPNERAFQAHSDLVYEWAEERGILNDEIPINPNLSTVIGFILERL